MATDLRTCRVCKDPSRYLVESEYIASGRTGRYSRQELETHLSHTTSPDALRQVSDLASASAVASRLRQLEGLATDIIEDALASHDGKLAVSALREARATIVEMSKLSGSLIAHDEGSERPDLDAAIARAIGRPDLVKDEPVDGADTAAERRAILPPS